MAIDEVAGVLAMDRMGFEDGEGIIHAIGVYSLQDRLSEFKTTLETQIIRQEVQTVVSCLAGLSQLLPDLGALEWH